MKRRSAPQPVPVEACLEAIRALWVRIDWYVTRNKDVPPGLWRALEAIDGHGRAQDDRYFPDTFTDHRAPTFDELNAGGRIRINRSHR